MRKTGTLLCHQDTFKPKDLLKLTDQISLSDANPNESARPSSAKQPTDEQSLEIMPSPVDKSNSAEDMPYFASLKKSLSGLDILWRSLAILVAIGITIVLYLTVEQEQIQKFQEYGYFGIFLTSLIGNASIALPIPSLFFTFVGGATFNWVIVGLVSGIGEALGESTGYLAGYGGSAMVENQALYKRMQGWMKQYGSLTIFALSVIPNPIIDLAGIAAGASKFGYIKFLLFCWGGKTIKTLVFAWAGANSMLWLLDYLDGFVG